MQRFVATAAWVIGFMSLVLGLGLLCVIILHYSDPGHTQDWSEWYLVLCLALFILFGLCIHIWKQWVISKEFLKSVAGSIGLNFDVESGCCIFEKNGGVLKVKEPQGFFRFDHTWLGPEFTFQRKKIRRDLGDRPWRLEAREFWGMVGGARPFVVVFNSREFAQVAVSKIVSGMRSMGCRRRVEVWVQEASASNFVRRISHEDLGGLKIEKAYLLVYLAPWDKPEAEELVHLASQEF